MYRGKVRGSSESGDGCRDEAVEVLSRSGPNEMLPSPQGKFLNRWSPVCLGSAAILCVVQLCRGGQLATNYLLSIAEWVRLAATACFQSGLETRTLSIRSVLAQHSSVGHKKAVTRSDSITVQQFCSVLHRVLASVSLSQQMFVIWSVIITHTDRAFTFESPCVSAVMPMLF